jgi:uncharacterized protein (TIGR02246 family)
MMKNSSLYSALLGFLSLGCLPVAIAAPAGDPADLIQIAAVGEAYVKAFEKGDAKAIAAFWTPDGDYVEQTGKVFKGREAIEGAFKPFFAANKGASLRIDSESISFPGDGVAIEDGSTSVIFADGTLPARGQFTNVFVKQDGKWLLASVRESDFVPPRNGQNLEGLSWAIGEWVEDSDENEIGHTSFLWAPGGNFIISRHAVTLNDNLLTTGTQYIAWDPASSQVRSWNFENDGGFGEGVWTVKDGTVSVQTQATLPGGKKLIATNTMSQNDDGTITWQSTARTLDGKPLPDTEKVKLKRVR